jgi:hypothetical protein
VVRDPENVSDVVLHGDCEELCYAVKPSTVIHGGHVVLRAAEETCAYVPNATKYFVEGLIDGEV